MLRFLFDTDHLTLYQQGHSLIGQRKSLQPMDAVGLGVVTVEESLRGRLAALARARDGPSRITRYSHLKDTVLFLHQFPIVAFDRACEDQFQHLLSLRLRVGTQDLKIGAIALAHNLTLVTRNRRDFGRIPGLALDDWSL